MRRKEAMKMLEFSTSNHVVNKLAMAGTLEDICTEFVLGATSIYGTMYRYNKDAARAFKRNVLRLFREPEAEDIVFDPDVVKTLMDDGAMLARSIVQDGSDDDKDTFDGQIISKLFGEEAGNEGE